MKNAPTRNQAEEIASVLRETLGAELPQDFVFRLLAGHDGIGFIGRHQDYAYDELDSDGQQFEFFRELGLEDGAPFVLSRADFRNIAGVEHMRQACDALAALYQEWIWGAPIGNPGPARRPSALAG